VTPIPDFEEFESRVLVSNQIVAALKDPNVNMVGVYGMSGAGKTTLAEKIGADLQLDRTFSYVVLATVSEKQNQLENNYQPNLLNIQKQIAGGSRYNCKAKTSGIERQSYVSSCRRKRKYSSFWMTFGPDLNLKKWESLLAAAFTRNSKS